MRFFAAEKTETLPIALLAREKFELDLYRQVYHVANAVLRVKNVFAILPCNSAFHMTKITIMENVNSAIFTIFVHCFRKQPS